MRRAVLLLPALAAFLLVTACGFVSGDPTIVQTSVTVPPVDDVRITSMTVFSGRHPPCPDPAEADPDPLPSGDPGIFATYEVANSGVEAFTYTIRFAFTTDVRRGVTSRYETVPAVGPGATVRGTVRLGVLELGTCPVTGIRIAEVTRVPAAEAPPAPGECSPSGIRLTAGDVSAATGLRSAGLHLENCGTRDYAVDGYPLLELLDKDRSPVEGVQILQDSGSISGSEPGSDEPARPLVLKPGESALSSITWRNTTEIGPAPVNVPYVRARAQRGDDPVTLTLHLDLGTTGKLTVRPWTRPPA
ncbi:hypothetical protein CC117_11920 [Parafrankia colletiae]|uniref:DUF4232 domain-containing protein n=1 Tax=Parafrankia colletiae TaxID=573497 RepID=A0A1S1R8K0_9ACTN|nr:DUF4232 domain-containing protein [Parafrankia colletiae]MCK9900772.1 DUF4232 domain-containing protein [Frankia sp. Cpl3]OHV42287.1 hypothetical protein CC117_11920 [Parafrankia colletiae]